VLPITGANAFALDPQRERKRFAKPGKSKSLGHTIMFTPQDILDFAVQLERNGESVYRAARSRASGEDLRALLDWAADEERRHAEWSEQLKADIADDESHSLLQDMNDALVSEYVKDQSFSLKEIDFSEDAARHSVGERLGLCEPSDIDSLAKKRLR